MPKIPTFITEARPTAEVGGVVSGIQVPVTSPFTGVQSALTDYYIQEKKKEAAVKTLDYKNSVASPAVIFDTKAIWDKDAVDARL